MTTAQQKAQNEAASQQLDAEINKPEPRKCPFDRSVEEAQSEVERELRVREKCFDRWVAEGRISRIDAKDRLERLAVANYLLLELLDKQS